MVCVYEYEFFFTVSIKHWINDHDMLFTSLNVVQLILISWFIREDRIQCKIRVDVPLAQAVSSYT